MTEFPVPSALPKSGSRERADIKRLMIFFALVYLIEGIGQTGGLIAQPLNYYLKQVYQWTPVQIAAFLTILDLPWFINPLYGLVSDFVPMFGYRRKTYLIAANAMAAAAYLSILQVSSPGSLIFLLLLAPMGWPLRARSAARFWSRTARNSIVAAPSSISNGSGSMWRQSLPLYWAACSSNG